MKTFRPLFWFLTAALWTMAGIAAFIGIWSSEQNRQWMDTAMLFIMIGLVPFFAALFVGLD